MIDVVIGDETGLVIPAHGEALLRLGPEFLTEAFRAFGSLSEGNSVITIDRFERCSSGSTGDKYFLDVSYANYEPGLHGSLFVKFSRDFNDQTRDQRGKFEMEGEVRFASFAHEGSFPVAVPQTCFADHQAHSQTGLLITEVIGFGQHGIEKQHAKCEDHLLDEPLAYYRVIVASLARVAAFSRKQQTMIDRLFPYDEKKSAASLTIAMDEALVAQKVRDLFAFIRECPQLFPAGLADAKLYARIERFAPCLVREQRRVSAILTEDSGHITLCHWNANIDNCWFWRDSADGLCCGLMDWGNAGQINLAFALWGCMSGAPLEIWNDHLDELLDLFADRYRSEGGGSLDPYKLRQHLDLYVAVMGLSYFMDSAARIRSYLPGVASASGPRDPLIGKQAHVRNQLHMLTNVLNFWRLRDPQQSLEQIVSAPSNARHQAGQGSLPA